jgi:peptide/nickel transport system substrate-binding protein
MLERFDGYWGVPAYLDRVTFRVYGSVDAAILAMNAGAIDITSHMTSDQVRQLSDDFYYVEGSMNLVQGLFLNNAVAPFDDVRVRQAMNYAIDVHQIMEILADGMGSPLGSGIHPAFTRYFNADLIDFYPQNPDRAVQLLAEAGLADGFDMEITVPAVYSPHVITAEIIVEQLREIGVRATINQVEWTYWVAEVNRGRNFHSTIIGLAASNLTAHTMLERYVSDNSRNFMNFSSAEYDEVFRRARMATDDNERIELYMQAPEILAREAASVFLQDLANLVAINRRLSGFRFYPIYVIDLSTIHFVE